MCTAMADDEPMGRMHLRSGKHVRRARLTFCQAPMTEAACTEMGETDDNQDATFAQGEECDTERDMVGICDIGDSKIYYYTGDAFALEIGCGFQGGDWILEEGEEEAEEDAEGDAEE